MSRPVKNRIGRSRLLVGLLAAVFSVIALVAWAFAAPVGATPDEDFHLTSIWCAHGERDGFCEPGDRPGEWWVSHEMLVVQCFAFKPEESAACQTGFTVEPELVSSGRGNFTGDYPPVFYWVMSWFAGPGVVKSVLLMRIFSALVAVGLVAAVAMASPPGVRRAVTAAAVLTAVPLGMFVIPSINPSGWAVVGAVTFIPALVGYLVTEGRRRWVLGGLAVLSLVIGAGSRGDAGLFAALGAAVAVLVAWRVGRRQLRDLILPVVLGVAGLATFLLVGQSGNAVSEDSLELSAWGLRVLVDIPSLWTGALGGWGLGWLDTYMPPLVWAASWSVLVGAVFLAIPGRDRRHQLALIAVGAAVWLVPGYMQIATGYPVGAWVQPRYILPLIAMLVVLALLRTRGAVRWNSAQWLLVVVALSVANSVALFWTIRRFVVGSDGVGWDLGRQVEWWWPGPVGPMVVWMVGSVSFAVAAALLLDGMRRPPSSSALEEPTPEEPISGEPVSAEVDGTESVTVPSSDAVAPSSGGVPRD